MCGIKIIPWLWPQNSEFLCKKRWKLIFRTKKTFPETLERKILKTFLLFFHNEVKCFVKIASSVFYSCLKLNFYAVLFWFNLKLLENWVGKLLWRHFNVLKDLHGFSCRQFSIILFFFTIVINPLIYRGKTENSCYFSQWKIFNCFKVLESKKKMFSDRKKNKHGKWKLANNKIHLLQQIFPHIYQRIFHTMKIFTLFSFLFVCF